MISKINLDYGLKIRNKTGIKNFIQKLGIKIWICDEVVTLGLFSNKFHSKIKISKKKKFGGLFFLGLTFWFSCKMGQQHWCKDATIFLGGGLQLLQKIWLFPEYLNYCYYQSKETNWNELAILMSGRQHKKLSLLIEFSNSILIKFYFKAYWRWTCIQNRLAK